MHNMQQLIEETLKLQKQAYHAGYRAGQQKERERLSRDKENKEIADNMRDYWKNLNAGSEGISNEQ